MSIVTSPAPPTVDQALAYLSNDATHAFAPVGTMAYTVAAVPGGLSIHEEGDLLATVADAAAVLDVVYRRIYQRSFELASLRGWVRLHAATVDLPRGRVLLCAESGTGKTTLASVLRLEGVDVPADESVLVRGGDAIPVPRRFHVKIPVSSVVPELRAIVDRSPRLKAGSVAAIDPRDLGGEWEIGQRPVTAMFLLERASQSRVEPLSAVEAMPMLTEGCFRNQESVADVLRAVSSVARTATCHRLSIADPRAAAILLRS